MIVKEHSNHEGQIILAIIDKELLGKRVETDELLLDFSSSFYTGKILDRQHILYKIKKAYMLNCAGEKTIAFLKDNNLISQEDINIIEGIPYIYVVIESNKN